MYTFADNHRLARQLISLLPSLLAAFACSASFGAEDANPTTNPPSRPNIIAILVDDMGLADLGCYGGEIPTPNIDALAAGGVRFSQFYNTGRCCPTRASLLTGLYSHQAGIGHMNDNQGLPSYQGFLNDQCVTLGTVLRDAGYFTAHTGKWHVGSGQSARLPLQRGFDRFYGVPEGGGFYMVPRQGRTVLEGNEVLYSQTQLPPQDWYTTDAWTKFGLQYIDEALKAEKPFFLYLAHNAPHFPLQALPEDIAKFRGTYRAGWDKLRVERLKRQKEIGLVGDESSLPERDATIVAWDSLSDAERDEYDHRMAIYAAVVYRLDRSIGDLVKGLGERKALDNTLLLFMSDNGASDEGGLYGKFGNDVPGTAKSDVFLGRAWAGLSNVPHRYYKKNSHEGGISTPLIAHWPAGIKARGEWRSQVGHVIDIMPTLVEAAGAKYPAEQQGKSIKPMEGSSLLASMTAASAAVEKPIERTLFWEHEGNAAVRQGHLKLVRAGANSKWELYDLRTDRTEQIDLAQKQPELAATLLEKWQTWAKRVAAKPFAGTPQEVPAGKRKLPGKKKAKAKS